MCHLSKEAGCSISASCEGFCITKPFTLLIWITWKHCKSVMAHIRDKLAWEFSCISVFSFPSQNLLWDQYSIFGKSIGDVSGLTAGMAAPLNHRRSVSVLEESFREKSFSCVQSCASATPICVWAAVWIHHLSFLFHALIVPFNHDQASPHYSAQSSQLARLRSLVHVTQSYPQHFTFSQPSPNLV